MRTVIVTGTSGALGGAIALSLIESGFHVVGIARRDAADPALSDSPHYEHVNFDLNNVEGIPALVKKIVDGRGYIYGLVNNSALGLDSTLATMHSQDISAVIRVNLQAPIELTKHTVRGMLVARSGRIINITSVVAQTGYKGLSVYASTKAGLEGFTKSLAREVGKRNITVNTVAPGFMPTDMTKSLSETQTEQISRRSALGRLVSVQEVASVVSFLMSDEASGITGQSVKVDAGATA